MQDDAMDVDGLDENLKQVLSHLPKELHAIVTKAPCGPNCTRGCLWAAFTLDATNTDLAIQARGLMPEIESMCPLGLIFSSTQKTRVSISRGVRVLGFESSSLPRGGGCAQEEKRLGWVRPQN